jgi:hypothetical protein
MRTVMRWEHEKEFIDRERRAAASDAARLDSIPPYPKQH